MHVCFAGLQAFLRAFVAYIGFRHILYDRPTIGYHLTSAEKLANSHDIKKEKISETNR